MDSVFNHTTNKIFNLWITHKFAFLFSHLNNIWVGSEYAKHSQTVLTNSWNTWVHQTPHTYSEKYFQSSVWVDSKFISRIFYSNPLQTHEEAYLLGKYSLWVHPKYTKPSVEYKLRSQDSVCWGRLDSQSYSTMSNSALLRAKILALVNTKIIALHESQNCTRSAMALWRAKMEIALTVQYGGLHDSLVSFRNSSSLF